MTSAAEKQRRYEQRRTEAFGPEIRGVRPGEDAVAAIEAAAAELGESVSRLASECLVAGLDHLDQRLFDFRQAQARRK